MGGKSSLERFPKKPPCAEESETKQKVSCRHHVAMTTAMSI